MNISRYFRNAALLLGLILTPCAWATTQTVSCTVFDDGYSSVSPAADAIYFADAETACIDDGTPRGSCRRWFGRCKTDQDNAAVSFKVFNHGYANALQADAILASKQTVGSTPNAVCIPDGSDWGACRNLFGMATTAYGSPVDCYLFDDNHANRIGPSNMIYYKGPGQVCTATGECRKWFGQCTTNYSGQITRIETAPTTPIVCNKLNDVCGIETGTTVKFTVWGEGGNCGFLGLNFGDGQSQWLDGEVNFSTPGVNPLVFTHIYDSKSWWGPKVVSAEYSVDCFGKKELRLNVLKRSGNNDFSDDFLLAVSADGSAFVATGCASVPGMAKIRANSKIHVEDLRTAKMNFGCALGGCVYDTKGEPNSTAPASYPFPGKRKYSLILRVDQQAVQGDLQTDFTTDNAGSLEVCINDDVRNDNGGAWGLKINVDETQAR